MLVKTVAAIAAFIAGTATVCSGDVPAEPVNVLTPAQQAADAKLMRRAYERVHPGLYRYQTQAAIDAAFDRLEAFAQTAHTSLAFYGAVSEAIAAIHCDHSKAEYPAAIETFRDNAATFFPFRFRIFDGRMYVASSDPAQPGLAYGTEIVAINGSPVRSVLATLDAAVSFDGFTSFVVPYKLEADSDLMGSDFETFYPVYYGFHATESLVVRERGANGTRSVTLSPITYKQWIALSWPALPYHSELFNGTSWSMLDKATAYLRVDSFVNYRHPVDPMAYYDAFFKPIAESGAKRLVVDLRWNGGGSTDATIALARFLMDRQFVWNAPIELKTLDFGDLPQYAQTWGDENALFHPDPRRYTKAADGMYAIIPSLAPADQAGEMTPLPVSPDRFTGSIVVLSGPRNASGSTMLISKLQDAGRATIVGQPTGGSAEGPTAGFILFLKLPNSGIVVRVPDMWNKMAVTHFRHGYGVEPDVRVEPTLEDFLLDRDAVLQAAR